MNRTIYLLFTLINLQKSTRMTFTPYITRAIINLPPTSHRLTASTSGQHVAYTAGPGTRPPPLPPKELIAPAARGSDSVARKLETVSWCLE